MDLSKKNSLINQCDLTQSIHEIFIQLLGSIVILQWEKNTFLETINNNNELLGLNYQLIYVNISVIQEVSDNRKLPSGKTSFCDTGWQVPVSHLHHRFIEEFNYYLLMSVD